MTSLLASFFIARRIIFPRSVTAAGKSFIMAVLCVALSLVPLISVLSVSNGLIYGMTSRIIGLSSSHIKLLFRNGSISSSSASSLENTAKKVARLDGVTAAYPEADAAALACTDLRREGVMIRAVMPNIFTQNSAFRTMLKVEDGSLEGFDANAFTSGAGGTDATGIASGAGGADGDSCATGAGSSTSADAANGAGGVVPAVAGKKTGERLGLKTGDTFRLVTAARKAGKVVPKAFTARMIATVSSGYEELDSSWVFIPLEDAYSKIGKSIVCSVLVETEDAFSPALYGVQSTIAQAMGGRAAVFRWDEMNRSEYENFASTQAMLICIMSLIVLVASLNISSSLVMISEERGREISILKCTGATQGTIEAAYLIAGGAAGLLGSILGVPLGLLCAVNMNKIVKAIEIAVNAVLSPASPIHLMDSAYYLSTIPLRVPLKNVILIVFVTLVLSVFVSFLPARRAGRNGGTQ